MGFARAAYITFHGETAEELGTGFGNVLQTLVLHATGSEWGSVVWGGPSDLPEGVERIALKAIHTNHVPMVAPAATLKGVDCQRIGLDQQRCFKHAEKLVPVLA